MRRWFVAGIVAFSVSAGGAVIPATALAKSHLGYSISKLSRSGAQGTASPAAGTEHTCYTFPGEWCYLFFNMSPGTAIVQARFTDGAVPTVHPNCPFVGYGCSVTVTAFPADQYVSVEDFYVNGPNIRNIEVY
jgi:hypothetical protein